MARIVVDLDRCKGCELCIAACPTKAIAMSSHFGPSGYYPCELIHPEKCTGCSFCAQVCPDLAIEVFVDVKQKEAS